MNNARFSLLVFGIYMIVIVGLGLLIAPKEMLYLFQQTAGDDVWIRFVGLLAAILGFYYVMVARAGLDAFIPWTIPARYVAAIFIISLVALRMVGPSLLLFAAVDICAATWTFLSLRAAK